MAVINGVIMKKSILMLTVLLQVGCFQSPRTLNCQDLLTWQEQLSRIETGTYEGYEQRIQALDLKERINICLNKQ